MTLIAQTTPSGYSIFCDDIRSEANGKQIFIGVYGAGMSISPAFPATLPTFSIFICYIERYKESSEPINISIFAPGESQPIFSAEVLRESFENAPPPPSDLEDPLIKIGLVAGFSGLVIKEPGHLYVRAYRGDDEFKLGSMKIELNRNDAPSPIL